MAKGSLLLVALVALIVGGLIGWLLGKPKPEPAKPMAGGHIIDVDKNAKVNKEEVDLDKNKKEVAVWIEEDEDKNLYIEFSKNEPFEKMTPTPDGKRWRVRCTDFTCYSGKIQANAEGGGKKYKYWQVVENKDGTGKIEVDGWIVIRP